MCPQKKFYVLATPLHSQRTQIMVLMHGEVLTHGGGLSDFTKKPVNWSTCVTNCHSKVNCIVAGFEYETCTHIELGRVFTIKRLNAYSEKMVAVKGTWTIQELKCSEGFRMFHRHKGSWCIKVVTRPGTSQAEGANFCYTQHNGVLSSFDSEEEKNFVLNETMRFVEKYQIHAGYQGDAYWMNGERKNSCMHQYQEGSDCDGIKAFNITDPLISEVFENWADNQPSGMRDNKGAGGCIVFRVGTKEGRSTDDVPCDWGNFPLGTFQYLIKGFICGTRPG
eukprot:NP_493489.2 C-type LECtin [Caenorhabditis elegans]